MLRLSGLALFLALSKGDTCQDFLGKPQVEINWNIYFFNVTANNWIENLTEIGINERDIGDECTIEAENTTKGCPILLDAENKKDVVVCKIIYLKTEGRAIREIRGGRNIIDNIRGLRIGEARIAEAITTTTTDFEVCGMIIEEMTKIIKKEVMENIIDGIELEGIVFNVNAGSIRGKAKAKLLEEKKKEMTKDIKACLYPSSTEIPKPNATASSPEKSAPSITKTRKPSATPNQSEMSDDSSTNTTQTSPTLNDLIGYISLCVLSILACLNILPILAWEYYSFNY